MIAMRPEPRSMTLVDVMAMVVGVAVGLAIVENQDVYVMSGFLTMVPDRFAGMAQHSVGWIWGVSVTMAAVTLGRVARHRRGPRPAEWLVIVIAIGYASGGDRIWFPAERVNFRVMTPMDAIEDFHRERSIVASLAGLVAVLGLIVLRRLRRKLPAWAVTIGLCLALTLLAWGPIYVAAMDATAWISPSIGINGAELVNISILAATTWAGLVPTGLLIGIPLVGAIADVNRRRGWTWVEWGSMVSSGLILPILLAGWRPDFDPGSWIRCVEWLTAISWVAGILGLSWLVHAKLGPIGRHWYS